METIFLACFAFGALFTLVSVVLGVAGHGAAHIGHGQAHVGPIADHAHVGHIAEHAHVGHAAHHEAQGHATVLPLLSMSSVLGALTWFGAAGYLLLRLGAWALPVVVIAALLAGAAGWYLVARFLGFVLKGEREMDPEDYRLEGTVGQVTVSIPAGGTGEVVFSKVGSRRSEAARGLNGQHVPRGTEVVIIAYADGFATVQPWNDFVAAREKLAAAENRKA